MKYFSGWRIAAVVATFVVLGSCASQRDQYTESRLPLTDWQQHNIDKQTVRTPQATRSSLGNGTSSQRQTLYPGGAPLAAPSLKGKRSFQGTVVLNLDDAELKDAAKLVLENVVGGGYAIDPRVTGRVNLKSQGPIAKTRALEMLETALEQNNAHLKIGDDGIYRVANGPAGTVDSISTGSTDDNSGGGGTRIIPLRHVAASEMAQILEPYAGEGLKGIDVQRNALILSGSASDFKAWQQTIRTFDVDWLAKRSVGVFKIEAMPAPAMITSLENIMANENTDASLIRLVPLEINNSILAVAKTPALLQSMQRWISRVEAASGGAVQLYTYHMKHAKAADIAPVMASIFNAGVSAVGSGASGESSGEENAVSMEGSAAAGGQQLQIVANESSNTLLIYANNDMRRKIVAAVERLDVPERQVLVEATIVEVTLNDQLRYGVQYALNNNWDGTAFRVDFDLNGAGGGLIPSQPGFSVKIGSPVEVLIEALSDITSVNVVSSPNLMVLNNRTARLVVGDQVPIATQTRSSALEDNATLVNTIEFRDTGIIFDVTPRITSSGSVLLDVSQEISSVQQTANATLTPTISQRRLSSSVNAESGQTLVLGGLFSQQKQDGRSGVPVLSKIPVLGAAFRRTSKLHAKTELLVLISPRIVSNGFEADQLTREITSRIPELRQTPDFVQK